MQERITNTSKTATVPSAAPHATRAPSRDTATACTNFAFVVSEVSFVVSAALACVSLGNASAARSRVSAPSAETSYSLTLLEAPPATASVFDVPCESGTKATCQFSAGGARDHNLGLVRGDVPDADLRVQS